MKILINTANLKKGGALQVAHSFITEIKDNKLDLFFIVLSHEVSALIDEKLYPDNIKFYHYSLTPGVIKVFTGKDRFLDSLEKKINPDCVFTIFGPSYWIPKSKHIMGYAIPHHIYPESPFFKSISLPKRLKLILLKHLHKINLRKSKAIFVVETNDVKRRLSKFLIIDESKIFIVSNSFNSVFNMPGIQIDKKYLKFQKDKSHNTFRFITITANYPHKNLIILKKVVPLLIKRNIDCEFFLTLNKDEITGFSPYENRIKNIGPVPIQVCPFLYYNSDALFLPTLLECFTASYLEAMRTSKPILTSDLSFARDICGDAAEYFNPLDADEIADKIEKFISDQKRRNQLIELGNKQLESFHTASSRAEKYLNICHEIFQKA